MGLPDYVEHFPYDHEECEAENREGVNLEAGPRLRHRQIDRRCIAAKRRHPNDGHRFVGKRSLAVQELPQGLQIGSEFEL